MSSWPWLLIAFGVGALALHLCGVVNALARCRPRPGHLGPPPDAPPVAIVRPVSGLIHGLDRTLRSSFVLDYPDYEILFCVADADDPAVPLVTALMLEHRAVPARLLIGEDPISINPKLNNCVKGWRASGAPWVVLADAGVLMPRDYLQRLLGAWTAGTGLVSSPPIGTEPQGFWAEVECAILNTYWARWQYLVDSIGLGFALGKTMLFRRDIVEQAGGIAALASEIAEDAAATKLVRRAGLRVRLVDGPFREPIGVRSLGEVWRRHVRWAKLRRSSIPLIYSAEILSGGLAPLAATAAASPALGLLPVAAAAGLAVLWYGSEIVLARACGWPHSWRMVSAMIIRDVMLPLAWMAGWSNAGFEWHGNRMRIAGVRTGDPPAGG